MIAVNIMGQLMNSSFNLNDYDIYFILKGIVTFTQYYIEPNLTDMINFDFNFDDGTHFYTGRDIRIENMDGFNLYFLDILIG